jgi:DNA polymerase-3 subunit gamma/tau
MSEFYKKHRPKSFSDVIGQEQATNPLQKMLKSNRLPHTILLCGPKGCGKTTLGRIIRKKLNCSKWDFAEVNCANKRGVDTIREIEHKAHILPMKGKTRIWLMDECHMLTGEASNAFLKILEDTPSHVYFILCTTDPQKLIATIRSRCMTFPIHSLDSDSIRAIVKSVCTKESLKLSKAVSDKIISLSDDSARNALVFLDKIALLSNEKDQLEAISEASVEAAAIQIARTLVNPRTTWAQMAKVLKETQKEDAEGMRWMILGYAKAMLINGRKNDRAYQIIRVFEDNWFNCKAAGLVACCYEIVNGM